MFCNFLNASGDTYVSCWTPPNFIPFHIQSFKETWSNLFTKQYEFFFLKLFKNYTRECKYIFDIQYINDLQSSFFKIPLQDFDFHESNFRNQPFTFN